MLVLVLVLVLVLPVPGARRARAGVIHSAIVPTIVSTWIGLEMCAFMPLASARSRSSANALAVIAITGRSCHAGLRRSSRVAV